MAEYSGTENLEVMAEALNYNAFLVTLIENELHPGQSVVDLGAGIGTFAKVIADAGYDVHCIEPDRTQLARIRESGLSASPDLDEIADASVDLLYSLNVLEHIEDDLATMRLCLQKLKPGGRIVIYVPAFQTLYSSMDKAVGHLRRYSRDELGKKARIAGFEILRNEYVDSAGFFASLVFKYFGNDTGTINRRALVFYDRHIFPLSRCADNVLNRVVGKNVFLLARRPCRSLCA